MAKLRVFEAFSGIGTQTMGLSRANIDHDVVAISEIDSYAIRSYEAIHGSVNNLGDISQIDTKTIPDHDLFTIYSHTVSHVNLFLLQVCNTVWIQIVAHAVVFCGNAKKLSISNVRNIY